MDERLEQAILYHFEVPLPEPCQGRIDQADAWHCDRHFSMALDCVDDPSVGIGSSVVRVPVRAASIK
jgi:hypothetical protein